MPGTGSSKKPPPWTVTLRSDLPPPIALGLWVLQDARRRTLGYLKRIDQATIDRQPRNGRATIGTLLYHLAGTEMDWLYVNIVQELPPSSVQALLPYPQEDDRGRLAPVIGETPAAHRARLDAVQAILFDALTAMDVTGYRRLRASPDGTFSAEWIVFHLAQHEAHHRGQIAAARREAERES